MVRCDRDRWANWLGNVVIDHPERHCYPDCLPDLVTIVNDAESHDPPKRVRACGSHWALSDVAVSPDWIVETNALRKTLYDVIPHALNDRTRQDLLNQSSYSYYHVEAGITIRDLNLRLDRQLLPAADRKWAPMPTDDLAETWPHATKRWAIPTMGGASGQTLAGAISTSTHGGDHRLPPMADMVQAIHLIAPGGRQLWIERDQGLTNPELLQQVLPDVEPRYCTELFNAVLVSVGRMGIIYALVLKVVEQFWLEQLITASTWKHEADGLRYPFATFDRTPPWNPPESPEPTHFVEAVLPPHPRRDGQHSCYMTWRWRTATECPKRAQPPNLFNLLCRHRTIAPIVLVLMGLVLLALMLSLLIPVLGPPLAALEVTALVLLLGLLLTAGQLSLGELLARACNLANRTGQSWIIRQLTERVIRQFRPRARKCDLGYEIMDLTETGGECYRGDALEVAFDARVDTHVQFMQHDLFPTLAQVAAAGKTVAGYIALRFTRKSDALLAMQQWDTTCTIEIALLKSINGNQEVFDALQTAAVRHGGTVHWGQGNTLSREHVSAMYPNLPQWRAQLTALTGHSRHHTFDNAYCYQRGLEPDITP
jgi:FAD/FMN-containing dehydrogenase